MIATTTAAATRRGLSRRQRWLLVIVVVVAWSVTRAGVRGDVVNSGGWPSFWRFWRAVAHPELSGEFLRLTVEAAGVTMGFAVLGTLLAVLIGLAGAPLVSERLWELDAPSGLGRFRRWSARRLGWWAARAAFVVPRGVHEVIWGLLLVQVFGFDPWVAVLAIGVPFGAVTAKVYADYLDTADHRPYRALRAGGAGRAQALAYGLVPLVRTDLVSYGFYRLECAVRSAAILGIVGAGGLGFQIDLSFQSLVYPEIWTLLVALMALSALADAWSSALRRRPSQRTVRLSWVAFAVLVPISWRWTGLEVSSLWSERTRRLAVELVEDLWPPRLGPGGWSELLDGALDTVAMSVLAIVIAALGGLAMAIVAARPSRAGAARPHRAGARAARWTAGWVARLVLLLFRAVPPPMWAFLVVLVLFPGTWPGAVALGVYNLGVLGRLFAEVLEDHDGRAGAALRAAGATPTQVFAYATLPSAAPRLVGLALYRWEVVVRETVVVGVVGAGGLGRVIQEHLVARDFAAVLGAVLVLIALTVVVDAASAGLRRALR